MCSPLLAAALALGCERGPSQAAVVDPGEVSTTADTDACVGAELLASEWTPARQQELAAALETLPGEWPGIAAATIATRVQARGDSWRDSYRQACAREDVRGQRCLDAMVWELSALGAMLTEQPETRAAAMWSTIARSLDDPPACLGRSDPGLQAPPIPPALGAKLARARLLLGLQELDATAASLHELEAEPTLTADPSYGFHLALLSAALELMRGGAGARVELQRQALREQAKGQGPRGRSALAQLEAIAATLGPNLADALAPIEEAVAIEREGADPWVLYDQLRKLGELRLALGDHAGAAAALTEAISLATRHGGGESPMTAVAQRSLAQAQLGLGRLPAAQDLLIQARDGFADTLGADHPETLLVMQMTGQLFMVAGQPADAHYVFLDLLTINEALYGPRDWRTAAIKLELGDALLLMGEHEGARTIYAEALTPLTQALGAEHRAVIRTLIHLGVAEAALGKLDEAEPHCSTGQGLSKALAPGDPLIQEAGECLAEVARRREPGRRR